MSLLKPQPDNVVEDNFTTDKVRGSAGNDHLIHHRDLSVESHSSVGMTGYAGDDILEGSVPKNGQIHMFGATGNDWFILDVTKIPDAVGMQGHHAYGSTGQDIFQFKNIEENAAPIVGRLDDFDPTSDHILIEDTEIDLTDLPQSIALPGGNNVEVRVISVEHPEFIDEDLGVQNFLAIGDDIFYALEGARDLQNGTSGLTGEERHFLKPEALETLRAAETVQYENPGNFAPRGFYEHREDDLTLNRNQPGEEVFAETGEKAAAHMFGGKGNTDALSSAGQQVMHGSTGDDVIDGNTGNDTIFGEDGNDLIAGGVDEDVAHGGSGDDMIWGGDSDDTLHGGSGNDFLKGGRGDDFLDGDDGNDTLFSGEGNNTLEGGGGEDAANRFHFYEEGGDDVITDFKVGSDLITLQDDIDPLTVELFENEGGNTVLNYAQTGTVELQGVALNDFQDAATTRAEEDNPIITVTPDPEEEMLQELRVETGFYGDAPPPELEVEGVAYGDAAFQTSEPGGYVYVAQEDEDPDPDTEGEEDESEPPSEIPLIDEDEDQKKEDEEEEEQEKRDEEEEMSAQGTCFVATAAYRDAMHPDVVFLRAFRDQWLAHHAFGRAFIAFYWRVGPSIAGPVRRSPRLAQGSKVLISGIVRVLRGNWTPQRA